MSRCAALCTAFVLLASPLVAHERRAPDPSARGKVFEWQSADGLLYEYFVPEGYDAKAGANLTLVLHGNGLDQRWTFANHPAGEFRPDDLVLSPDGTTPFKNTKANEFLCEKKDCDRVHALIEEWKKAFNVNAVFLYGHSQGSFFVFYYAGERPDDVTGVLGQSSGILAATKLGKFGHKQAIALMHGTDDGNVPYFQSVGARELYRNAGYPAVHLRTLWNWPHAPSWQQANLELAWCEGITSGDPARVFRCLEALQDEKKAAGMLDFAAIDEVAARLEKLAGASAAQKEGAGRARAAVAKLGAAAVAEITQSLGKAKLTKMDGKPWLGLVQRLLEDLDGVPARNDFVQAHASELNAVDREAQQIATEFWHRTEKEPAQAFAPGANLLESGWKSPSAAQAAIWLRDFAKGLRTSDSANKKELARLKLVYAAWEKGRADGFAAWETLARSFKP